MRRYLLLAAAASISTLVFAQKPAWQPSPEHTTINIWPNGAPGAQPNPTAEIDTTTAKDNLIAGKPVIRLGNVSTPTLTLYSPQGNNTGAAVVVFPGGGSKFWRLTWKGLKYATGSTPQALRASYSNTGFLIPDRIQNPLRRFRTRSVRSESCDPTQPIGESIRTASACSGFPREDISPPRSALTSISASTIRLT